MMIRSILLLLLYYATIVTAESLPDATLFACNDDHFCSNKLLKSNGEIRNFRHTYEAEPRGIPQHYYGAIAMNPQSGMTRSEIYRDSNQIISINDAKLGKGARRTFRGVERVERLVLTGCPLCEIAITFRDGCAALAWSPTKERYYRALFEYEPHLRPIKSSGKNPYLHHVAATALQRCQTEQQHPQSTNDCRVVAQLCTDQKWP